MRSWCSSDTLPADSQKLAASLDLASATSLESLRISILPNVMFPSSIAISYIARATECLCHILSSLAPTVKRVVFELSPTDIYHHFMWIDWESLASVDWRRFADFERFSIVLNRGCPDGVADEIRRKLYAVAQKGILDVRKEL